MRLLPLAFVVACTGSSTAFELPFEVVVGDAAFDCGATYEGLGDDGVTAWFTDARFYVQDLTFVDAEGEPIPSALEAADAQRDGVVLIDAEDGSGTCATGSPTTHTTITGTVDDAAAVAGVRFVVGVPESLNHVDPLDAAPPLDAPGMFWGWTAGYKFLKVEVATEDREAFWVHVGATGCTGTPGEGFTCGAPNRAAVALDDLSLGEDAVVVDLAALFDGTSVEAAPAEGDGTPGCMSGPTDAECAGVFAALGLAFGDAPAGAQSVFSLGAR